MNIRSTRLVGAIAAGLALAIGFGTSLAAEAGAAKTTRVSVSSRGIQGDEDSTSPALSRNGRFVAFKSEATNLIRRDTNRRDDIFVRDRKTGMTRRVSVSSRGIQADKHSFSPAISADGRFVAFTSQARNLVRRDTNGRRDVFVHDRKTGATRLVSVDSEGVQADGHSGSPAISADGRLVAFHSRARNLVSGHTGRLQDIFVHDRRTGETSLVSVSSGGIQTDGHSIWPSISANGRFVAFRSAATNLVVGDTNGEPDIFVHDLEAGATTRVSLSSVGEQADRTSGVASISAAGRFVVFGSSATNLVAGDANGRDDAFVNDRTSGETTLVSLSSSGVQGNGHSAVASISADGRLVTFASRATNLVEGDTNGRRDIFVNDRETGKTTRVSVSSDGEQADKRSDGLSISADGRFVAFSSRATNLVRRDANRRAYDIFVRGPLRRRAFALQAKPKRRTVGPRRRRVRYRLRATNSRIEPSGLVRLCARAPKSRVKVRGQRCRAFEEIAPGTSVQRVVGLKVLNGARGKLTQIKFLARGPNLQAQTSARLRVRR